MDLPKSKFAIPVPLDNMKASPVHRPIEVNTIDHIIRCYGGGTIALEMEPARMQQSKQPENVSQYVNFLSRKNGELRLEANFYRDCFRYNQEFKATVATLAQDLLNECIIGLLDDVAFDTIKAISKSILEAVDRLREGLRRAFDEFVAPYKAEGLNSDLDILSNGMI